MNESTTPRYVNDLARLVGHARVLHLQAEQAQVARTIKAAYDVLVPPSDRPTPAYLGAALHRAGELEALISEVGAEHASRVEAMSESRLDVLAGQHKLDDQDADLLAVLAAIAVDPSLDDAIESANGWRSRWGRRTPGLIDLLCGGDTIKEIEIMGRLGPAGRLARLGLVALDEVRPEEPGDDLMSRQVSITAATLATIVGAAFFDAWEGESR